MTSTRLLHTFHQTSWGYQVDINKALDKLSKYPPSQQKDALIQAIKNEYTGSLYKTCKGLLGYKDLNLRTHGSSIAALESDSERTLLVLPRGSLKSSMGVVGYSTWSILNNPNIRILIDSEVYTNSKNFLREIRAHLEGPKLTSLFGEFKGANWSEGEITIKQRTKALKEATITCGGVNTIKVGQHYDLIIFDDLNSNQNSATEEGRKKVIDHYKMTMAILDPGGKVVVIGTRYSAADLIQHIIDNEIGYDLACELAGLKI